MTSCAYITSYSWRQQCALQTPSTRMKTKTISSPIPCAWVSELYFIHWVAYLATQGMPLHVYWRFPDYSHVYAGIWTNWTIDNRPGHFIGCRDSWFLATPVSWFDLILYQLLSQVCLAAGVLTYNEYFHGMQCERIMLYVFTVSLEYLPRPKCINK